LALRCDSLLAGEHKSATYTAIINDIKNKHHRYAYINIERAALARGSDMCHSVEDSNCLGLTSNSNDVAIINVADKNNDDYLPTLGKKRGHRWIIVNAY
jgi:hypothetical protein